ncbi:9236_t:CDS:2 [Acaulospora colombiana]|uniref:9236_t:CDS:1 n=1 Tax=Acaulospora colombiana TaxID=27376 RepID=A0ACA9NEA8_9GLOM|nr:9236_t:CDS:2 [Acaulospora colombiana]
MASVHTPVLNGEIRTPGEEDMLVTINAIAIFAVSQSNDNAPTFFDGESPEAPTPAEKLAFGKNGSQASIFKLKSAVSEQATHGSVGNTSGSSYALAKADCSNASITSEYRLGINLFDYLPKDQVPSPECQETVLKSAGDVAAHSLFNVESHPVVHSQESQRTWAIRKGGMGEVSTHQYRRGSRGLLAELSERFGKASPVVAMAEDLAIEVEQRIPSSKPARAFIDTTSLFFSTLRYSIEEKNDDVKVRYTESGNLFSHLEKATVALTCCLSASWQQWLLDPGTLSACLLLAS